MNWSNMGHKKEWLKKTCNYLNKLRTSQLQKGWLYKEKFRNKMSVRGNKSLCFKKTKRQTEQFLTFVWAAQALAINVLPVPGGPYNSTPTSRSVYTVEINSCPSQERFSSSQTWKVESSSVKSSNVCRTQQVKLIPGSNVTMNIVTPQHEILLQGASKYVIRFCWYSTGAHLYFWAERKCESKESVWENNLMTISSITLMSNQRLMAIC